MSAFIQSDSGVGINANAVTTGITTTTGNAIFVGVGAFNNNNQSFTVSDNMGNTYTQATTLWDNGSTDMRSDIWFCLNATGGAGHQITVNKTGNGRWCALVNEWSGIALSSALDKTAVGHSNNGDPTTASSGTLSQADEVVFVMTSENPGNPGVGTGYSNYLNVSSAVGFSIESKIVASTAAVTGDFATGAQNYVNVLATFKAAAVTTTSTSSSISTSSTSSSTSTSSTSQSTSTSLTTSTSSTSQSTSTSSTSTSLSTSSTSSSISTSTSLSTSSTSSSTSISTSSTSSSISTSSTSQSTSTSLSTSSTSSSTSTSISTTTSFSTSSTSTSTTTTVLEGSMFPQSTIYPQQPFGWIVPRR